MAGRKYLNALRQDIARRRFGGDGTLPTLKEMARHYRCSLSSIRQAVEVLKRENVLYTVAGKGTFVGAMPPPDPASRFRMIGAVTLRHVNYDIVENLKHEWQRRGWLIANYNAWEDLQAPELERNFLEQAGRGRFAGVVLNASPFEPSNASLYAEMRRNGLKVLHLSPYREDMSEEAFIVCDYRAAGRLAVATALRQQCGQAVMVVNNATAPFMSRMRAGVEETARALQLPQLPTLRCDNWSAVFHESAGEERLKLAELGKLLPAFRQMPERTAIFCCGAEMAGLLRRLLSAEGLMADRGFFILSLNNGSSQAEEEGGVVFDFEAQTRRALDYICDDSIHAMQLIQEYLQPAVQLEPSRVRLSG